MSFRCLGFNLWLTRWPSGFFSFALLIVLSVPSVKRTPMVALGQTSLIPFVLTSLRAGARMAGTLEGAFL